MDYHQQYVPTAWIFLTPHHTLSIYLSLSLSLNIYISTISLSLSLSLSQSAIAIYLYFYLSDITLCKSSKCASSVSTELMNVSFCKSASTGVSICSSLLENVAYEFDLTSFACLIWVVCKMGSKWQYNCCFVRCCFQNLPSCSRVTTTVWLYIRAHGGTTVHLVQ